MARNHGLPYRRRGFAHYIRLEDDHESLLFRIFPKVRLESATPIERGPHGALVFRPAGAAPQGTPEAPIPRRPKPAPFQLPVLDPDALSEVPPLPLEPFDPSMLEGDGFTLPPSEEMQACHLFPLYDRVLNCWSFDSG